ncbi:acetylcholine receptor subunit alpha-like [Pecten maximus]|uniref:acetylcholine receptor subunit alpha-like n=1 Tax=Pecten maximus TaxID=6579 RepID=UPI001458BC20|nr:acetylcholine receptor subunit alpha-like [Pecten maximus]
MAWNDVRLDWSSLRAFSSHIPAFYADEDTVWRPPIIIENSVSDISVMSDKSIPIRVFHTGDMTWNPSGIYKTTCDTDVTFYPFDTQVCDISISTWGYTAFEIALNLDPLPLDMTHFRKNGEWKYISYSTSSYVRGSREKSFSVTTFQLKLKRRPMYHVLNTLTPTILLAFLSCMTFKLPVQSGERIGFSLTVLLSYAVYLSVLSEHIPTTSVTTSLLSLYLLFILTVGMISVLLTILVLECHHSDPNTKVPNWLLKTVDVLMVISFRRREGRSLFRCCPCARNKNNIESIDSVKEPSGSLGKESKAMEVAQNNDVMHFAVSWLEVGRLLDGCFLRIFLFVVLLVTFMFLMALCIAYGIYEDTFDENM